MSDKSLHRLNDILDAINQIELLLGRFNLESLRQDRMAQAALERFVEIVSEASRHAPAELKLREPGIPWRRIADIGDHLRHAYHAVDIDILWRLHADGHMARLRKAVERYLGEIGA